MLLRSKNMRTRQEYDIIFIGHVCYDEVIHQDGLRTITTGGAALYGAVAAASTGKTIAALLKLAPEDQKDLDALKRCSVRVFTIDSRETTRVQVIHRSPNMDERQIITLKYAGLFKKDEIHDFPAGHIHLAGCNDHEFSLDFIKAIKQRGYPLSIDMQCFARYNDPKTGEVTFNDDSDKKEVVSLMDKVKLDILEVKLLTGTDDVEKAAEIVESWGCPEVLITRSDGALLRSGGKMYFEKFSNKNVYGRTGRGDTIFGAYLARRVDYEPAEALKFAAALVSIKMESSGPFSGTLEDVLNRIRESS